MIDKSKIKPFDKHVWLATPTPHPEMLEYVKEAYDLNWLSTEGKNIKEVERIAAEKAGVKYAVGLSCCTAALHICVKLAGERLYGKSQIGHGAVEGKRVMTALEGSIIGTNGKIFQPHEGNNCSLNDCIRI